MFKRCVQKSYSSRCAPPCSLSNFPINNDTPTIVDDYRARRCEGCGSRVVPCVAEPSLMDKYALRAVEEYPDKRFVVHNMHPLPVHRIGDRLRQGPSYRRTTGKKSEISCCWERSTPSVRTSCASTRRTWSAHCHTSGALVGLDRKTVVTADHGNMVGERVPAADP